MSEIIGRFDAAYDFIAEHRGYVDAHTMGREEPALLGISLECTSGPNLLDNANVRKVVYRHYFSNVQAPTEPSGIHAHLSVDSQSNIEPYFARTYARGKEPDVVYDYRVVRGDRAVQSERIMGVVERALFALGFRSQ